MPSSPPVGGHGTAGSVGLAQDQSAASLRPRQRGRVWLPKDVAHPVLFPTVPVGFSQSLITEVFPPKIRASQVYIRWTSSAPAGTWFQVYIGHNLTWWGQRRSVRLPIPSGIRRIDIGTVQAGQEQTSFAATLPAAPARRATVSWTGGTYLDAILAGFYVYSPKAPNGPVDYTKPVATITAYPSNIYTDGYGMGGYGLGGYGQASGSYSWTSNPLALGTWNFAVKPFDTAGNLGTAQVTPVVIAVPPHPPGPYADATRLHYTIATGTHKATITWLSSPG
jgi:hypothetical protein